MRSTSLGLPLSLPFQGCTEQGDNGKQLQRSAVSGKHEVPLIEEHALFDLQTGRYEAIYRGDVCDLFQ